MGCKQVEAQLFARLEEVGQKLKPPVKVEAPGLVDNDLEARLWSRFEQKLQGLQKRKPGTQGSCRQDPRRTLQGECETASRSGWV